MNYEHGGWYDHNGKNQQYWNGQWYDSPQQGNSSGGSGNPAQSTIDELNANDNKYIDQLIAESKGQLDLILKNIDAKHKLALGNNDTQTAQFLEKVASELETRVGRIPYDYQKYTNRELQDYAMGNQNIEDNKRLLTDKLANDQRLAEQELKFSQGNDNQSLVERLNEKGLLGTGKPTGMYQGENIQGLDGIAGFQAGLQNAQYEQKYDALNSGGELAQRGINLDASQRKSALDFAHTNNMTDLTDEARRGVQDQQLESQMGRDTAQSEFERNKAEYERRRMKLQAGNQQLGGQLAGASKDILGF